MKSEIIILANKYPNSIEPNVNVFTQQLAWSFADLEYKCTIICPTAINYDKRNTTLNEVDYEKTERGNIIQILRPKYIGFGQNGSFLQKARVALTTHNYKSATEKILKKLNLSNAVLFAEFLCPSGVTASLLGKKYGIRSYMQCGEATYQGEQKYGNKKLAKKLLYDLSGVIALSSQNKNFLVNAGIVPSEKIIVLPSGYRKERIYPKEKMESRRKFGFPEDKFIVGFCGSFDNRKGVLRLEKAVDQIEDKSVVFAACGKGECEPTSTKCLWKKPINHKNLADFYSAIDVFAFPTYNEGCCTAIVEAIACGCPIISSDRPFNYEICDKTNSILLDPDNISDMKDCILYLKNNPNKLKELSEGSLKKASMLSLDDKVKKVVQFMQI